MLNYIANRSKRFWNWKVRTEFKAVEEIFTLLALTQKINIQVLFK